MTLENVVTMPIWIQEISPLIAGFINLFFAIFVFLKNRRSRVNLGFSLLSLCLSIWNIGDYFSNPNEFANWDRFLFTGVAFIPFFALLFIRWITSPSKFWRLQRIYFVISLIFTALAIKGWFLNIKYPNVRYLVISIIFYLVLTLTVCVYLLIHRYRETTSTFEKNRLRYIVSSALIGFLGGLTNYFHYFGIYGMKYGHIANSIYTLIMAYVLLQMRLIDLGIFIKRIIRLISVAIVLTVFWAILFFIVEDVRRSFLIFLPIFIVVLMFLLQPLYPNIARKLEAFFFHDEFVKRQILEKFSDSITHRTTQESLISTFVDSIREVIPVENGVLYVSNDGRYYHRINGFGSIHWQKILEIPDVKVVRKLRELKNHFIKEEFQEIYDKTQLLPDEKEFIQTTIKQLQDAHLEIIVHFTFEDKLFGIVGLGKKLDETVYTNSDVDFLIALGNQFALSYDNLLMLEEMRRMERMAFLGQMASVVAHEVRNPLGSIEMSAGLIIKDNEKQKYYVSTILEETSRLKRLVSDFLDFGRPLKPNIENINLCEIVEKTLKLIETQKNMEQVSISRQFHENLFIHGDSEYIRQIVINLIQNSTEAINYQGKIEVELFKKNGEAVISVKDSGEGIPKDKLQHIFEPFYTTKTQGSGLGLAIVKRLIESQKGKIEVVSEEKKGTVFTISFSQSKF